MSERGRSRLFGRPTELLVEEPPPRILMPLPPPRSPNIEEITEDTRNDLDADEEPSLSSGPLRVFVGPPSPRLATPAPGVGGEIDGDALGELGSVLGSRVPAPRGGRPFASDPNRTDLPDVGVRPSLALYGDESMRTELLPIELGLSSPGAEPTPPPRAPIERIALPGPQRGRAAGLPTAAARGLPTAAARGIPTAAARGLPTAAARGGGPSPVEIEDEEATWFDEGPLANDDRPRGLDLRLASGGVRSPGAPSWDDLRFSKPDASTDAVRRPSAEPRADAGGPAPASGTAGGAVARQSGAAPALDAPSGALSAPVASELAAAPPSAAPPRRPLALVLAAAVVFGVSAWLVGQRFGSAPPRPGARAAAVARPAAGRAPVAVGEATPSAGGGGGVTWAADADGGGAAETTGTVGDGTSSEAAPGAVRATDAQAVADSVVDAASIGADPGGAASTSGQGLGEAPAAPSENTRPTPADASGATPYGDATPVPMARVEPRGNPTAGPASGWRLATPEELAADEVRRVAAAKAATPAPMPARADAPKAPAAPGSGTSSATVAGAIVADRRGGYQLPTGLLQVVCNEKASIYVDDKRVGTTTDAKPIELPAGTHRVRVVSSRGSRTQQVRVDPGQLRMVEFRLR